MPGVLIDNGRPCCKNSKNFTSNAIAIECNVNENPNRRVRSCFGLNLRSRKGNATSISDTDYDSNVGFGEVHTITTPLQAAIQTATIFNGIVVGKDGVLLSQNERAETGLLGKMIMKGQSRQAVKIEQMVGATDCGSIHVEDCRQIEQDRKTSSPTPQILIVRGRFDDFNRLISEGAEILRKGQSLCWLPRFVLGRISDYCSSKDIVNLSQSCKIMCQNMKETRSVRSRQRRRLLETKLHRWRQSNSGSKPQHK